MNLTGKCKQDFEAWFSREFYAPTIPNMTAMSVWEFYKFPLSMQFGVIQEWADSVGLYVHIEPHLAGGGAVHYLTISWRNENFVDQYWQDRFDDGDAFYYTTRESAQIAAIEKLNEIYNER